MYTSESVPVISRRDLVQLTLRAKQGSRANRANAATSLTERAPREAATLGRAVPATFAKQDPRLSKQLRELAAGGFPATELAEALAAQGIAAPAFLCEVGSVRGLRHLVKTVEDRVHVLDLRGVRFAAIPKAILAIRELEHLDLWRNGMRTLGANLRGLGNLRSVRLVDNPLVDLGGISGLHRLAALGIYRAKLRGLPASLAKLPLRELCVVQCRSITTVPAILDSLALEHLELDHCGITAVDVRVFAHTTLRHLDLSGTQLGHVPADFGKLHNLRKLAVRAANLLSLPEAIGTCTKLEDLDLFGNRGLKTLPAALGALPSLARIRIAGCGLTKAYVRARLPHVTIYQDS